MDALTKHLISVMDDCNYKKWQDVPYAKDFYKLWYGNPAQLKGYVCACGNKCDDSLICYKCKG